MDIFPLEGDQLPKGKVGWLLFFDEANSADRSVQKAWYKTVLDRKVGNRNIHQNVVMMSAGNLETDNAIVEEMSTALESRMVHYEIQLCEKTWLKWATSNGIDHRITSFIQFSPTNLYTFKPDHPDSTYACPRTWEFANRFMSQREVGDKTLRNNLAGTLSEGVAREFLSFCQIYTDLPKIHQIVSNPKGTPVPTELSIQYAMTGSLASNATEHNITPIIEYLSRFTVDLQVVCLSHMFSRDPSLADTDAAADWIAENQATLW